MSILKLLFALNPKNLKLVKAEKMTPDMANQIDSFLGKIGAVVNIGKYKLTPKQTEFWLDQRKELTRYENKLKELQDKNKLRKREGIETLPEADVIDFPVKPKPPEGEPFAIGGRVGFKKGGNYWLMVQEAYDAAGGEEQTGLSLFDFANKYFPRMADGGRVGLMAGGILKGGKKILDLTKKAKKTKKDVKRQMTDEEIKDFADEYGIDPTDEYYTFDGTLADAKRILKESEDYKKYMYQQYKKGKLDPVAGEQSPARMKLLRQKLEEAGAIKDKRLISDDELEELYELEKQYLKPNEESSFPKKGMFDDVFDKMFSEYEYDQYIKSGRKPNADGGSVGMNVDGYKKGGSVKKSLSEKIIGFLGGKDATAAELGLLGMEQLYNLLGLPFYSNGGAVGMPPISTSDPKEAGKIILDSILGSSVETIPLYQGDNLGITAGFGIGSQRPIDYGVGFNYGNFQGGVQMNQGKPSFGIGYRKEFSNGGRIGYKAGGVQINVRSLPATATDAINQFGQDAFNARNLQQYYYPIGATGDADQGAKKPIGLVPAGTILPPKPGTIGYKEPEPTPTPTTSMAGKELRTSVVEQLKRLGFILSDEDLKRILSTYGVLSLKDGGTVETGLTKTIPPVRGPMSEGVESLFRTR